MAFDEINSSHYVASRLSLWCPMCGASESQGCTPVYNDFTLRYASHNAVATGQVPRAQVPMEWETTARKDEPQKRRIFR